MVVILLRSVLVMEHKKHVQPGQREDEAGGNVKIRKMLILLCLKSLPVGYVGISEIVHHVIFNILAKPELKTKAYFIKEEKGVNSFCFLVVLVFKLDFKKKNVQVVKTVTGKTRKTFSGSLSAPVVTSLMSSAALWQPSTSR